MSVAWTMSDTILTTDYILTWIGYDGQSATREFFRERENFEQWPRHAKSRILDTLSDQDLWTMWKDKRREGDLKLAEYFERELNHRKNPEKYVKDDLNAIKERVNLLDVIEHYVGTVNYRPRQLIKCPLPKHQDSSASFSLNPERWLWKCFGCQAGGSQVDFIMYMQSCDLKTAINKLKSFV